MSNAKPAPESITEMALYSYNNFVRSTNLESSCNSEHKTKHRRRTDQDGSAVKDFYDSVVGLSSDGTTEETTVSTSLPSTLGTGVSKAVRRDRASKHRKDRSSFRQHSRNVPRSKLERSSASEAVNELHTDVSLSKGHTSLCTSATPGSTSSNMGQSSTSVNKFLHAAQDGDLKQVKALVDQGSVDLNVQDSYGWTALMCASQAGHLEVVEYLLWQEANMFITDNTGISALDLAKKNHNKVLVDLLVGHINGETYKKKAEGSLTTHVKKLPKFYCLICKKDFEDCTRESHETSTIHLFNMKLPVKSSNYLIPESNRGFQMLVKSGWDKDRGLGTEGQGQKHPVKTVLKRDRKGLGLDDQAQKKARVTHFDPHDPSAVKSVMTPSIRKEKAATRSKKAAAKKLSKEREFEKKYRMEFHME